MTRWPVTTIEEDGELHWVKACPFCKCTTTLSIFGNDIGRTVVNCTACNVSGPHTDERTDDDITRAVAMWNGRPE